MNYTNNHRYQQDGEDSDSVEFIQIISKIQRVVKENKELKRKNHHLISQNRQLGARNQLLELQMNEYMSLVQEMEQQFFSQHEYVLDSMQANQTRSKNFLYLDDSGDMYRINYSDK
ncbi:hypothetical protein C1I60_13255 [Paenibacillus terrae]|uniref:Uncharacterized protein n=1 Tax=Paenibacillus terrae TaxID=159743 RepID=A0A4U2PZK1_9BACL|nr:hypothetical protein [Paenibacillus terrae]TKH44289.1 hypothetical protein C1I60_13255 [Paenibacillus terrae]